MHPLDLSKLDMVIQHHSSIVATLAIYSMSQPESVDLGSGLPPQGPSGA